MVLAEWFDVLQAFQQGRWRVAKAGLLHAHTLCEPLADVALQTDCDRMIGACTLWISHLSCRSSPLGETRDSTADDPLA